MSRVSPFRGATISQDIFLELLSFLKYEKSTGNLFWIKPRHRSKIIGLIKPDRKGYISFTFKRQTFLGHRVVWFIEKGSHPIGFIDHINGNPADNRIENLRQSTPRQNQMNRKSHRNGSLVGAQYDKRNNIWASVIKINGEKKRLGSFKSEIDAHEAYMKAYKSL